MPYAAGKRPGSVKVAKYATDHERAILDLCHEEEVFGSGLRCGTVAEEFRIDPAYAAQVLDHMFRTGKIGRTNRQERKRHDVPNSGSDTYVYHLLRQEAET